MSAPGQGMRGGEITPEIMLRRRRMVLLGDILIMLFGGLVYSWSLFVNPLEGTFGWVRSQTSLTFTFCSLANTTFAFTSAVMARKWGSKKVIRIFGVVAFLGFIGAATTQSLLQIYLCYGIMCGGAIGAFYNQTLGTVVFWFRDKSSLITGVLLMCYGMGSLFLSPLINLMLEHIGWRMTFGVLAVLTFALIAVTSAKVRKPTEEEQLNLPGVLADSEKSASKAASKTVIDYTPSTMIRTKSFWFFAAWNMSIGLIGLTMSSQASPLAQSVGISAGTAAFFVGLYSLFNGLGRVLNGMIFDKVGRKISTIFVSCFGIVSGLTLIVSYRAASTVGIMAAFIMLGFTFSGGPVCSSSMIKELFGEKNYGMNLGFGNLSVLVSAFAGPYLAGFIYESWGYGAVAIFLTAAAGFGLLFAGALALTRKI